MSENENRAQNPRVFVSYSWDSPEHRLWVESLAQELRKSGIDARLDAWRDESQSIDDFMMVELERADFVLAICTPEFKRKIVDNAEGSATASGFEMGTAAALRRLGGKEVIPVLRSGEWTESAPSSLVSYRFYDFSKSDVSEEFTQLRDRLLGHIRRPPELGEASGPAAAPELPDIFAKGLTPEPQPTAPPAAANTPRSGPPTEQPAQVIIQQAPAGYSKGKVWGTVGAIILVLVVLWNIAPDPEETSNAAPQSVAGLDQSESSSPTTPEQSQGVPQANPSVNSQDIDLEALSAALEEIDPADLVHPQDRWGSHQTGTLCTVSKEVAPGAWLVITYETQHQLYAIATYDNSLWPALGAQHNTPYPRQVVFQLDDDFSTAMYTQVIGYEWNGHRGVYRYFNDSDYIEDLEIYEFLNLYHYDEQNPQDYINNPITGLDLTGSIDGIDRFMSCVEELRQQSSFSE